MRKSCYAVLSLTLLVLPGVSAGQEPTNQLLRQLRQADRVLSPHLEIREFGGEFERWSKAVTVSAPGVEVFRWSTLASGTVAARWSVMDGPPGSGASVLGSGSAGSAPEPGSVTAFRIDFSQLFQAGPPARGATYWVVLEPLDAARQAGPISAPVQVTYAGQVDIGAFAGREADIVAQKPMSLSNTSKLVFLRDLVRQHADALAGSTADVAFGDAIRLTPGAPIHPSPDASAQGERHWLEFENADVYAVWGAPLPEGRANLGNASWIDLNIGVLPKDRPFLLDIYAGGWSGGELQLESPAGCSINFQPGPAGQSFVFSGDAEHLLAVVQQTIEATRCRFRLHSNERWVFLSAELSQVFDK
jgi:hypothetical protein